MVLRTNGVRGVGPMAPNSKTCTSWGAWIRWARIAATWGMPNPLKAVFWSPSRRAQRAIITSASVYSLLIGSPRTAGIVGFRSPRPLGPQPQGGLRLALRPRDVLRLALPRSPVALLDGGAAAEVVEAGQPHALLEHLQGRPHAVHVFVQVTP